VVLPCSAVDLVCDLLQEAQMSEFSDAFERSPPSLHLCKAILTELKSFGMFMGAVTTQKLYGDHLNSSHEASNNVELTVESQSAMSTLPSHSHGSGANEVGSFVQKSLQTLREDCLSELWAALTAIDTMFMGHQSGRSASTTPTQASYDLVASKTSSVATPDPL
jgi:hypothetical protein